MHCMCFLLKGLIDYIEKEVSTRESLSLCANSAPVYKWAIMKSIRNRTRMCVKSILNLQSQLVDHRHQLASYWRSTLCPW